MKKKISNSRLGRLFSDAPHRGATGCCFEARKFDIPAGMGT